MLTKNNCTVESYVEAVLKSLRDILSARKNEEYQEDIQNAGTDRKWWEYEFFQNEENLKRDEEQTFEIIKSHLANRWYPEGYSNQQAIAYFSCMEEMRCLLSEAEALTRMEEIIKKGPV